MNAPLTIKALKSLRDLFVFRDFIAPAGFEEFRSQNLIYAFNGAGKSTISRAFASLGAGELHRSLPPDCQFEFQLSDNSEAGHPGRLGRLKDRVFVFNGDFVRSNFNWADASVSPVFHIGREQKEKAKELESKLAIRESISAEMANCSIASSKAKKVLDDFKRDSAREIAEALLLGRGYNATHLVADLRDFDPASVHALDEEQRRAKSLLIGKSSPRARLDAVSFDTGGLAEIDDKTKKLLNTTLVDVAIDAIFKHEGMLSWVNDGLSYHEEHGLSHCAFCGNAISPDRTRTLQAILNDDFRRLQQSLRDAVKELTAMDSRLESLVADAPRKGELDESRQAAYATAARDLEVATKTLRCRLDYLRTMLEQKISDPQTTIECAIGDEAAIADLVKAKLKPSVATMNSAIAGHNELSDSFSDQQAAAREALKHHYLISRKDRYDALVADLEDKEAQEASAQTRVNANEAAIRTLRAEVRTHGPAASTINGLIQSYLGHNELEIETVDGGYRLLRDGAIAEGPPSEGEKTAIVLCYFLVMLSGEGRRLEDLIVVLDDPISSLDTRALNYAASLIMRNLASAGQLFILTHNLPFMLEIVKPMKPHTASRLVKDKKDPSNARAALFFIETLARRPNANRESRLVVMPKYIREYESEYHFLFHLMLSFINAAEDADNLFHLVPNALRKLLDIFMAFRHPQQMGFKDKLCNLVREAGNSDDAPKFLAVERLVQVESHADNLDDLVSFSSMTIEEAREAAKTVLALMRKTDERHTAQMEKLCSP